MLDPLYTVIAYVLKLWHDLFSTVLDPAGGITWALSIAFLVVTVRVALFRFFVKQVKSQRAMQEIQPEIAKLKKQYGSDRQGFSQAMMALQKERGVNPLAGCWPILPQFPVFISLYHVLSRLAPGKPGLYSWDDTLTEQAAVAKLFGAPISSQFNMPADKEQALLGVASYTNIRLVAFMLIVIMCVTTYVTQKQVLRRSGPVEGQAAMVQKAMLYGVPASLAVSGFFFPIGVLLYWFTNNLWTLGQQFYILKKLPPPGASGNGNGTAGKGGPDGPDSGASGRTLAPRPGAKPVRTRPGAPTALTQGGSPTPPPAGPTGPAAQPAGGTAQPAGSTAQPAGGNGDGSAGDTSVPSPSSGSTAAGSVLPAEPTGGSGAPRAAAGAVRAAQGRSKRKRR